MMRILLRYWLLLCWPLSAIAAAPLAPAQAFILSAEFANAQQLNLTWQIALGYHLYRDRFEFTLNDTTRADLAPVQLPSGILKQDTILGNYQIYLRQISIPLHFKQLRTGTYALQVKYQGCAETGFCYPPINKTIHLRITPTSRVAQLVQEDNAVLQLTPELAQASTVDPAAKLLAQPNLLLSIIGFIGLGLLLAFTPCVLPMLPILMSIIVGQDARHTPWRAGRLAGTYVVAMALTYALAGIGAALAGNYVQAIMQNKWIIGVYGGVLILLALSLFDIYQLRLPVSINNAVTNITQRTRGGTYLGVFSIGCLSVLIVSPCLTAPLLGVLTYLSSTGNVMLGGTALFALGIGMGIPLLILAISGGKWLPKAGPWLLGIKKFFGLLLFALAIWLWQRVVPQWLALGLWASFWLGCALYFSLCSVAASHRVRYGLRLLAAILFIGSGILLGTQVPTLLARHNKATIEQQALPFKAMTALAQWQPILAEARRQHKPILLDFYADWCVSCKLIDANVLRDARVQAALANFVLVRVDVTANNQDARALQQYWHVIAPPTLIFYDANGLERVSQRLVGEVTVEQLIRTIMT